ncbi:MAG TPA: c-type cytochrome [Caulobacteraceae bacterium]
MKPGRIALLAILAVVALGAGVFAWIAGGPGPMDFAGGHAVQLADYKGPSPTGVPADFTSTDPIARGQYLTRAADCQACHTAKGGVPFAGGLAFNLQFGTIWSPNITPDKDTGIGGWTDAQFLGAMHKGVDDQGQPLYPAMPYAAFAYMTDADAMAIKAYLFSLPPVHQQDKDNTFAFPFNQRWAMSIWSALFNPDQRFQPRPDRAPEWNRGLTWPKPWPTAATATPRATSPRLWTIEASSPAPWPPAGGPTTSAPTASPASAPGATRS